MLGSGAFNDSLVAGGALGGAMLALLVLRLVIRTYRETEDSTIANKDAENEYLQEQLRVERAEQATLRSELAMERAATHRVRLRYLGLIYALKLAGIPIPEGFADPEEGA